MSKSEKQKLKSKYVVHEEIETDCTDINEPKVLNRSITVKNAFCETDPSYFSTTHTKLYKNVSTSTHKINNDFKVQSVRNKEDEKYPSKIDDKLVSNINMSANAEESCQKLQNIKCKIRHSDHEWSEICSSDIININEIVEHIISESRPVNLQQSGSSSKKHSKSPKSLDNKVQGSNIKNVELMDKVIKDINSLTQDTNNSKSRANNISLRKGQNLEWKHLMKIDNGISTEDEAVKQASKEVCVGESLPRIDHKTHKVRKDGFGIDEAYKFNKKCTDFVITEGYSNTNHL